MTSKIEKIWIELEEVDVLKSGLLYRRYSAIIKPDIYIALKSPEQLRCIVFRFKEPLLFEEQNFNKLKDIKIEIVDDDANASNKFLLVVLLNKQYEEIFGTLCEDLILKTSESNDEKELLKSLFNRLELWKSLFERIAKKGLSNEEQRGLFGELYFLKWFLKNSTNKGSCVKSWVGPEKAVQDFQYSTWAVEVKTTHGNNHQKIFISNERQLDSSFVEKLYLFHISLDVRHGAGISLNSLIDEIILELQNNVNVLNLFKLKLFQYGYFNNHRSLYENTGYTIRDENIYSVTGSFPRLTENLIPSGVGDIKYSIIISAAENWALNIETFLTEIT